ncbi:MAG: zf-HC2 domain-containing protein [Bryobacteraceae bacterium]
MECPIQARGKKDLLLDFCAHTLDAKAAAEVEAHVAACPECKAWTDAHMRTWTLLDDWEPAPISPDFERKLRERIALEDERTPWWKAVWQSFAARPLKPALSAALVCLLLLAGLLFVRPWSAPPVHRGVETIDADRLEKALDDVDMLRQVGAAGEASPGQAKAGEAM